MATFREKLAWRKERKKKTKGYWCKKCNRIEYDLIVCSICREKVEKINREFIYKRDNYKCVMCGEKENLTLDHIIPISKGGKTELNNLQTMCKRCNKMKGNGTNPHRG